jgi:5-methylcytosine-specific restriction protein A
MAVAKLCKETANYTCATCNFQMKIGTQFIIECHHLTPFSSLQSEHAIKLKDLVALCPTCHRIAHTEDPPLSLKKIRYQLYKNSPVQKVLVSAKQLAKRFSDQDFDWKAARDEGKK